MKKEAEKASKSMEATPHKADEAAEAAKKAVDTIAEETVDKMGWKTEEDLNKPENQPFMARLTEIHVSTHESIDANLAKYEKHVEAAKLMFRMTTTANESGKAVLDTNYEAFEKLKKQPKTWDNLEILLTTSEALQRDAELINEFGPEKMGSRTKAEILTDMNDQVIKFREYAKEIAEHKVKRLGEMDQRMADFEAQMEAKDPKASSAEIADLWDYALKIRRVAKKFDDIPGFETYAQQAREKFSAYWQKLQTLDAAYADRSPELKTARGELLRLNQERKEAKKRLKDVQENSKSSDTEKAKAQDAYDKALAAHKEQLQYYSRLAVAIDEADLEWGANATPEMIAAAKMPDEKLEGKDRLALNTAIEAVEDADTVKGIKRAMIRLGTLIAEYGLNDISVRRRLQDLGFRLPPLGAQAKEFRLVYYDPDTGDKYERSVKPLTQPVELEEKLADVEKKGIKVLNDLDTRSVGTSLPLKIDGISVKITKLGHREYRVGGKAIAIQGDETPLYERAMAVALRKKRVRAARAVPGVRYVKAEKPTDKAAA